MSLYTLRTGATSHPEDSVLQEITDIVSVGGVLNLSSDNHFKVTERGAGANMSIDVASGRSFVKGSGNCYPARSTATENVAIASNGSGNDRIDAVVLYINLGASPDTAASNVATLTVVQGTPDPSPAAPSDGDISTSIGASNPFIRLANVLVQNATADIQDADITDTRTHFVTVRGNKWYELTDGATIDIDYADGNMQYVVLGGNRTLTVANMQAGDALLLRFVQDATGSRTLSWWSNIDWYGGTPVLTTTGNRADTFGIVKKPDGRYDGFVLGQGATIS